MLNFNANYTNFAFADANNFYDEDEVAAASEYFLDTDHFVTETPEMALIKSEERDALAHAISLLSEREQFIINALYAETMTQEELADKFDLTQPTINYIAKTALKKLEKATRNYIAPRKRRQAAVMSQFIFETIAGFGTGEATKGEYAATPKFRKTQYGATRLDQLFMFDEHPAKAPTSEETKAKPYSFTTLTDKDDFATFDAAFDPALDAALAEAKADGAKRQEKKAKALAKHKADTEAMLAALG